MFPSDLFRFLPARYGSSGYYDRYSIAFPAGRPRDVAPTQPCYKCGNPAKPAPTANGKPVCRRCVNGGNRRRGRHPRR